MGLGAADEGVVWVAKAGTVTTTRDVSVISPRTTRLPPLPAASYARLPVMDPVAGSLETFADFGECLQSKYPLFWPGLWSAGRVSSDDQLAYGAPFTRYQPIPGHPDPANAA